MTPDQVAGAAALYVMFGVFLAGILPVGEDGAELVAITALWPVVVAGLVVVGTIRLYRRAVRRLTDGGIREDA